VSVHPLAIVSLSSSVLAYASVFFGSTTLIYPAIAVALVGSVTGVLARQAIRGAPDTFGGWTVATVGVVSSGAFVGLGVALVSLARRAGGG